MEKIIEEMRRIYGDGTYRKLEDKTRCVKEVSGSGRAGQFIFGQCKFKRGFGNDHLYCKKHELTDAQDDYYSRFQMVKIKVTSK